MLITVYQRITQNCDIPPTAISHLSAFLMAGSNSVIFVVFFQRNLLLLPGSLNSMAYRSDEISQWITNQHEYNIHLFPQRLIWYKNQLLLLTLVEHVVLGVHDDRRGNHDVPQRLDTDIGRLPKCRGRRGMQSCGWEGGGEENNYWEQKLMTAGQ